MPADPAHFWEGCGAACNPGTLALPRARAMAAYLLAHEDIGARLVDAREGPGGSCLRLEVEVDVGQAPLADIRRTEPVALCFEPEDDAWPVARSLREDFPRSVSHLMQTPPDEPATLCLSEERWQDARPRWTPGTLVRLLRTWLIDTARGALHRGEQPLEPFVGAGTESILLPRDLYTDDAAARQNRVAVRISAAADGTLGVYRVLPAGVMLPEAGPLLVVAALAVPPQLHGVIRRCPRTVADLRGLFGAEAPGFAADLDRAVSHWMRRKENHAAKPLVLVQVPLMRSAGEPPERTDTLAFILGATARETAVALDLWSTAGDGGPVLPGLRRPDADGRDIGLLSLNVSWELTRAEAATFNGQTTPSGQRLVAIGAGALGSQILTNLARMGETVTAVIDYDRLQPHNYTRHAVTSHFLLGHAKAGAVAHLINDLIVEAPACQAVVADATIVAGEDADSYRMALAGADLVLDLSASVAVARALALTDATAKRRLSAFLNPTGSDLVLLAEDAGRRARLDHLEMNYYAGIADTPSLAGHLTAPTGVRYARGCRDLSSQIPQPRVAMHAATAAAMIRRVPHQPDAMATIWRLDPETHAVAVLPIDTRPMVEIAVGGWALLFTQSLLEKIRAARAGRLPRETGGVLMGDIDLEGRRLWLATGIGSPPDSVERRGTYIRGSFGLQQAVAAMQLQTQSMLRYLGEWHAHPDGVPATPSRDDLDLYGWVAAGMAIDGYPPLMLIVGEAGLGVLLEDEFLYMPWPDLLAGTGVEA